VIDESSRRLGSLSGHESIRRCCQSGVKRIGPVPLGVPTNGSASFPATTFLGETDTYSVKVINTDEVTSVIKDNEDMPKLEAELFEAKHE